MLEVPVHLASHHQSLAQSAMLSHMRVPNLPPTSTLNPTNSNLILNPRQINPPVVTQQQQQQFNRPVANTSNYHVNFQQQAPLHHHLQQQQQQKGLLNQQARPDLIKIPYQTPAPPAPGARSFGQVKQAFSSDLNSPAADLTSILAHSWNQGAQLPAFAAMAANQFQEIYQTESAAYSTPHVIKQQPHTPAPSPVPIALQKTTTTTENNQIQTGGLALSLLASPSSNDSNNTRLVTNTNQTQELTDINVNNTNSRVDSPNVNINNNNNHEEKNNETPLEIQIQTTATTAGTASPAKLARELCTSAQMSPMQSSTKRPRLSHLVSHDSPTNNPDETPTTTTTNTTLNIANTY